MNLDLHEQLRLVEKSIYNIKIIKNPHIKVQLKVVSIKGFLILYIENPPFEVQLAAVEDDMDLLSNILKIHHWKFN